MELGNASSNVMGYNREYPCLYRGVVEDNIDPEHLGRCKIRVPSVHGSLNYPVRMLPWARPLVLSPVKNERGSVNLPDKGDIVWVLFEGANKEFPIYLGGTYAKDELDVSNDRVDFYIEKEDKISYERIKRIYDITIGPNAHITVSPERICLKIDPDTSIIAIPGTINLKTGNKSISLNTTGITIHGDTFIKEGHLHVRGDIISASDVYSRGSEGNISLNEHVHDGVTPGPAKTKGPVPGDAPSCNDPIETEGNL